MDKVLIDTDIILDFFFDRLQKVYLKCRKNFDEMRFGNVGAKNIMLLLVQV